jgi:NTP pyrophosphatase (non-canonical NTP hydrolase)
MNSGDFSIGGSSWPGTSKLLEEMGELQQVLGKLIGSHGETAHYDGSDLKERLVEEIADVLAAIAFFQVKNLPIEDDERILSRKHEKLKRFLSGMRKANEPSSR